MIILTRSTGREKEGSPGGKGPLSKTSVREVHNILSGAFTNAIAKGLLVASPTKRATPPKADQAKADAPDMVTWTSDQLRTFLAAERNRPLYPVWVLLATTGMRRGEALGLRRSDLDLKRPTVRAQDGRRHPRQGCNRHPQERQAEGHRPGPADGRCPTRTQGAAGSRPPRKRSDLVRHTWATLDMQAGVHPKVVQERLGHATIGITLGTYSHVAPTMQADAAKAVAASFLS